FSLLETQGHELVFNLILLSLRVAALLIGAVYEEPTLAIILFSLVSAFAYFCLLLWFLFITGNSLKCCAFIIKILPHSILINMPLLLYFYFLNSSVLWLIFSGMAFSVALVLYYFVYVFRPVYKA